MKNPVVDTIGLIVGLSVGAKPSLHNHDRGLGILKIIIRPFSNNTCTYLLEYKCKI
jgi:hypothetical protein